MADETKAVETGLNSYGINKDPKLAAIQVKEKTITLTENVDKAPAGVILETFSITVKGTEKVTENDEDGNPVEKEVEKVYYKEENQPFGWTKLDNFQEVCKAEGAEFTEEQAKMLGDMFSSEAHGKVLTLVTGLYNADERSKAKANEYARIMGIFKPVSEEDRDKAKENMVKNFARGFGVSIDEARKTLKEKGLI